VSAVAEIHVNEAKAWRAAQALQGKVMNEEIIKDIKKHAFY